jgi:hypothetical protein
MPKLYPRYHCLTLRGVDAELSPRIANVALPYPPKAELLYHGLQIPTL